MGREGLKKLGLIRENPFQRLETPVSTFLNSIPISLDGSSLCDLLWGTKPNRSYMHPIALNPQLRAVEAQNLQARFLHVSTAFAMKFHVNCMLKKNALATEEKT